MPGVVLVLHGGREFSTGDNPPWRLPAVRMQPFARAVADRTGALVAARLRYRYRGWNGDGISAVEDARWALDGLAARYPDAPIVIIGHSMGGRVATNVAGHAAVRGVVALAPWLPSEDPVEQLSGRSLLLLHGTHDRTTSKEATSEYARRADAVAREVVNLRVRGAGHAMLRRSGLWHHLSAAAAVAMLDGRSLSTVTPTRTFDAGI